MTEQELRPHVIHRSSGRRKSDSLPEDWIEARPLLQHRLDLIDDAIGLLQEGLSRITSDVHAMAGDLRVRPVD